MRFRFHNLQQILKVNEHNLVITGSLYKQALYQIIILRVRRFVHIRC